MSKTSIWWVLYFPSKSNALISTLWANITFNMFGACSSLKENSKAKVFTTHSVNSLLPWWIWRKTILNYHESHESWLWSIFFHHLNLQVMEDWTQSLTTIYFHLLHEVHKSIASSPTPGFARGFLPPVCDAAEFLEASMIPSLSLTPIGELLKGGLASVASHHVWESSWVLDVEHHLARHVSSPSTKAEVSRVEMSQVWHS